MSRYEELLAQQREKEAQNGVSYVPRSVSYTNRRASTSDRYQQALAQQREKEAADSRTAADVLPAQSASRVSTALQDAGSVYNAQRPGAAFRAQRQQAEENLSSRLEDLQKAQRTQEDTLTRNRTRQSVTSGLNRSNEAVKIPAFSTEGREAGRDTTPDWLDARREELENQLAAAQREVEFYSAPGQAGPLYQAALQATQELPAQLAEVDRRESRMENSLDAQRRELQRLEAARDYNRYGSLSAAPDFTQNSAYRSTDTGGGEGYSALNNRYDVAGRWGDPLYEYINRNEEAISQITANDIQSGEAFMGFDERQLGQMTDEEIATFNYLYNTEGRESAYDYIDYITGELYARQRQQEQAETTAWAQESPVLSSVYSVLTSPLRGLSYVGQGLQYLSGEGLDANAGYNRFVNQGTDIRAAVSEDMGGVGSFLYNTGMSMADFLVAAGLSGGSGAVATTILGSGAAAQTVVDAKQRGLSDSQAFTLGTISGVAEALTEKFSVDALLDGIGTSSLGYFLRNAFTEGSEEVASDVINTVADVLIAKDKSEWRQSIARYMQQGMSEQEAFRQALLEQAQSMGLDFLGGALSGGVLSGAAIAGNALLTRAQQEARSGRVTNRTAEEILDSPETMQELGVTVAEDAPVSEKRDAVRQAVEQTLQTEQTEQPTQQAQPVRQEQQPVRQVAQDTDADFGQNAETRTAAEAANDLRRVREAASAFGESGRRAAEAAYDGRDAANYYGAFAAYYQAGLTNRGEQTVPARWKGALSEAQRYAAYTAGQNDAQAFLERDKARAKYAPVAREGSGLVFDDYVENELYVSRGGDEAEIDQRTADQIDDIAKALGLRVRFVDSVRDGTANAQISGSEVLVSKGNRDPAAFVVGHEITHRLQQLAPEEYRAFRDFAAGATGNLVQESLNRYRSAGVEITYEQALDEATADFAGSLIYNSDVLDEFIRRNLTKRSLLQKVKDMISDLVRKLRGRDRDFASQAEKKLTDALKAATRQAGQNARNTARTDGARMSLRNSYAGRNLAEDSAVYSYDFLTALPDMQVTVLPDVSTVRNAEGRVDTGKVVEEGMKNARAVGTERDGKVFVRNAYTGKQLFIRTNAIRHGLNGSLNRVLTNARLGAVIGDVVQNAVPINALQNRAQGVDGTYAMAGYATDSRGREFVAIVTVEQSDGNISGVEVYDVTHAVSGRQKNGSQADTKSQDVSPIKAATISISDFLEVVNSTHQSILSDDVLSHLGETRSPEGDYTDQVRFSLRGLGNLDAMMDIMRRELRDRGASEAEIVELVTEQAAYNRLLEQYGMIEEGERPARSTRVPRKSADGRVVSQTVRTVVEAGATPDAMIPDLQELIADGTFSYDIYTDEAALRDANRSIRDKGWETALADWRADSRRGIVSKAQTALGWALYNNAANKGNTAQAVNILEDIIKNQRNAAQALQATRMLKKQTPEAQLYGISRSVQNLQEELREKYRDRAPELKIDEELASQFLQARSDTERERIMQDIYRDIGKQVPSTFLDKWNAWRYLAMLGNPRTHIRNIAGNAFFYPLVWARDQAAGAIEAGASRLSGGRMQRRRSPVSRLSRSDRELLDAASGDYENVTAQLMGAGKYTDSAYANRFIEEGRQVFRFKPLEAARRGNSRAMDVEDAWFSRGHYRRALAMYCKANGISAQQIRDGKVPNAARQFAVNEALKATYRDMNAISNLVSRRFSTGGRFGNVGRAANTFADAVLPFRRTPANILARGLEYSPLGLIRGIWQATGGVHRGTATAAEAIDSITTGLTGSGLFALGFYLAAQGLVRGGGTDEEEQEFEELLGHQAYSLELPNGLSITLDWLAPQALPFFVGTNLYEQMQANPDEAFNMDMLTEALYQVTDPLLFMSMLQSLQDMIDAVSYAESGQLVAMVANAATSYLTQAVPTLLGQIERTLEPIRMTTYTDANRFLSSDLQYTIGRASARLPGVDYSQIPYIDAWGRQESSGNPGTRSFNNFLNPAYTSTMQESEMEQELLRLYEATGDSGVFPSRADRYFNIPDPENKDERIRKDLTGEEYVKYATTSGQAAYEALTGLVEDAEYQALSDEDKAEVVKLVYSFCRKEGQRAVDKSVTADSQVEKALEAKKKYKISYEKFALVYFKQKAVESLKDAEGETIDNSSSLLKMDIIYKTKGLTSQQRKALISYFVQGKTVSGYNASKVTEELNKMRREQRS